MTSCSRVNMVRADWAAEEGGGGALVIAILLTEGCGARQYPARDCLFYCPEARKNLQGFPVGLAGAVVGATGVVPVVMAGPMGVDCTGVVITAGGGAYFASQAITSV